MTRIMIVDDYKAVREGLKRLLEAEPDFEVVGEAASGLGVAALVDQIKPDVLILDIGLPDISGLEVLKLLGNRLETLRVVMLSMFSEPEQVSDAFHNGALAYVHKDRGATELTDAIYEVLQGHQYLSSG